MNEKCCLELQKLQEYMKQIERFYKNTKEV